MAPLHDPQAGSQAALPVRSQEAKTASATHSAAPSGASSAAPSADPSISVPVAGAPASRTSSSSAPSAAVPASNAPSQTAPTTLHPSTASHTTSRTTNEASSTSSNGGDPPVAPAGYPKLALKMGDLPETAIFRRFGFLNAQNLLYMQAELVNLEDRLRRVQAKDDKAPGSRSLYSKNWFFLGHPEAEEDGDDEQWELVKEIREKLKEYNEMLIQQFKIASVNPPGSSDLHYIQRYLVSEDMDNGVLTGKDSDLWGSIENPEKHAQDLLALLGRHNEDFFSSWVAESVADKLTKLQQNGRLAGTPRLSDLTDKKLLRWTFMITSVLASALPILSIAVLYCVRSIKIRLGLIGLFNIVLSCILAGFTSAKRAEVFGVCAAFSAVCVVFVQVGADDPHN